MNTEPLEIIDRRSQSNPEPEQVENALAQIEIVSVPRVYEDPKPRFDNILVARKEKETTFNGTRFFIPDTVQKAPNVGVVIAISDFYIVNGQTFPTAEIVKPGDIVTFGNFQAEDIKRGEQEFALVSVFDIKLIEKCSYAVANAAGA